MPSIIALAERFLAGARALDASRMGVSFWFPKRLPSGPGLILWWYAVPINCSLLTSYLGSALGDGSCSAKQVLGMLAAAKRRAALANREGFVCLCACQNDLVTHATVFRCNCLAQDYIIGFRKAVKHFESCWHFAEHF